MQQQSSKFGATESTRVGPPESLANRHARPRVMCVWEDEYPWDPRTEKVCSALMTNGFEVHLVARNRRWAPRSERRPEGIVHRMRPWRALGRKVDGALAFPAFFNPRWTSLLSDTVQSSRADVMIVRGFALCPAAIRVGRRFGVPVMLDLGRPAAASKTSSTWYSDGQASRDLPLRNPAGIAVERYCVQRVARILVSGDEAAERLERDLGVSQDHIDVVLDTPPRACAVAPRPIRNVDSPLELVCFDADQSPRGVGDLLQAIAQLRQGISVRLTVVSDRRSCSSLRERAARLGLMQRELEVRELPSSDDARSIVTRAHVCVAPQRAADAWNGSPPRSVFDCMAAGLAVVSSDAGPAARIVRASRAGELFRGGDAADLARCIRRLVDPNRCAAAGEAGRRAVLEHYHWEQDSAALAGAVALVASARHCSRASNDCRGSSPSPRSLMRSRTFGGWRRS